MLPAKYLFLTHFTRCFRAAYSDHCASKHASLDCKFIDGRKQNSSISAVREGASSSVEIEPSDINISDMRGQPLSLPFISDDDDWVANCVEKEYIPVLEDVGCVLKVKTVSKRARRPFYLCVLLLSQCPDVSNFYLFQNN